MQENGPDPEETDEVMLVRNRVSRIYYLKKFFDYPISLKWETLKTMGFGTTMQAGFSFLHATLFKRPNDNLENYYINSFGKKLYSMFFEGYTEKLWGRHPREISADWGSQRVKGLSIMAVIKDMFSKIGGKKDTKKVETSLIEEFYYPKFGPGQLWETTAEEFEKLIKAGTAAAEDWRCYGLIHEYMAYHCIRKATGSYHQAMDRSRCTDPELYHRTLRQSILLRCRIGEGETCIREREAALQECPDSVQAWIDLAHACFFGGQPEKTLETCEKALEKFPEEGLLHVYAGDVCRALKDYDRAFIHWQKAVELDQKYMDALFSMAFCREELGQYEKAARNWEDIARRLEEQGMEEEDKMTRNMAEKCRAKLFG